MPDFELDLTPDPEVVDAEFFVVEPVATEETLPELVAPAKLSTAPIVLNLVPYEQYVALRTEEAKGIIVTDVASQKKAISAASLNKRKWKELEEKRKQFVAPYNQHVKDINALFHELQDPLAQNEVTIKREIGKFEAKLEIERKRIEAIQREEQRKRQAEIDAEAKKQREEAERKAQEAAKQLETEEDEGIRATLGQTVAEETAAAEAPTPQVAAVVVEKPAIVRTSEGSAFTKPKWVCRIVDPALVPREYCEPSQKLLDAKVKGGVRNIPGCVIEEERIVNIKC